MQVGENDNLEKTSLSIVQHHPVTSIYWLTKVTTHSIKTITQASAFLITRDNSIKITRSNETAWVEFITVEVVSEQAWRGPERTGETFQTVE